MKFSPLPSPIPATRAWGALNSKKGYVILRQGRIYRLIQTSRTRRANGNVHVMIIKHRVATLEEAVLACEQADNEQ